MKNDLRNKFVELYGEEFGKLYDDANRGIAIGGMADTIIFLNMVDKARKELEKDKQNKWFRKIFRSLKKIIKPTKIE